MNLGKLKSLGHNMADSLASGIGFLIGMYEMDVFKEAAASDAAHIEVDFLNATTAGSPASKSLVKAISLYRDALPEMCAKHKLNLSEIKALSARYGTDAVCGPHFSVTVKSMDGKHSTDQYVGVPGRRMRRRSKL